MHLCNYVLCYDALNAHTHPCTHTCTWTQPGSLPPPFASPCVWCGLWRTMFKEILLQLWSRSVFPTLVLLCFLFYLLTVCELGGKQAGVEQDTCPTYTIYHVLYLWTWEVSRVGAIVSCKIWVHPPFPLPKHCSRFRRRAPLWTNASGAKFWCHSRHLSNTICEGSCTQLRLVCFDKYARCH